MEFKVDFQCISIRARKDPKNKWHDIPYLETDDVIDVVLDRWSTDWCTDLDSAVGSGKSTA